MPRNGSILTTQQTLQKATGQHHSLASRTPLSLSDPLSQPATGPRTSMSLHQCNLSASKRSPSFTPQQQPQPNLGSGIAPGGMAPQGNQGIFHRSRYALALLPLLLSPLTTSCTLERIAAPTQNRANPAQAAEQAPTDSPALGPAKSKATLDIPPEIPSEPPKPNLQIPQLMSQASSTANSELFPAQDGETDDDPHQGPLRVGNQTEHPLRIAFLAQGKASPIVAVAPETPAIASNSSTAAPPTASSSQASSPQREPFHWDFAPAEGGRDGLLLALPEGDLALQSGDVIVAFAQDGSQRYWGPYVVGQTSLPHWNSDRDEWQLLVQP